MNRTMLVTLCPSCRQRFFDAGCFHIRRVSRAQTEKEPCTYCQVRSGYDYYVESRRPCRGKGGAGMKAGPVGAIQNIAREEAV